MTISSTIEMPVPQSRRPPTYFPGNDEDPSDAGPPRSADFSFGDLLDVINPLQHIPVVSTIYRAITGDTISPTASVMGSVLYGGPVGALVAGATEMVSEMTGGSPETHLLAMVGATPEEAVGTDPPAATTPSDLALAFAPAAAPAGATAPMPARAEDAPASGHDRREGAPVPSALFQALQFPERGQDDPPQRNAAERAGRDIRSYISEVMPGGPSKTQAVAAPDRGGSEGAAPAGQTETVDAEREAARAAVAAVHARGVEMLRQQSPGGSAPAQAYPAPSTSPLAATTQVPPESFPDLMMRGLEKYRESSRLGGMLQPTVGTAG